jgi:CubicO group peptidase (beta-lactamase class C family)
MYKDSELRFLKAYGNRMIVPHKLPMLKETLFDLASLTKPITTVTSVMILNQRGNVDLNRDLTDYLPNFTRRGIKLFHLLTHTSGLSAWRPLYIEAKNVDVVGYLNNLPLEYETGSKVVYSCLGYILLGKMVKEITGIGLDEFAKKEIFGPLGMKETFFNPPEDRRDDCAATEDSNSFEKRMTNYRDHKWREGVVVGEVHDENAHFLGGIAGNAGLFSTASDLMRYSAMLINGGENILSAESVKMIATIHTPGLNESRGIGWIIYPDGTLYHSGFTGTAMWINLEKRASVTLLTNRVHPDATKEGIIEFRQTFYRSIIKPFIETD